MIAGNLRTLEEILLKDNIVLGVPTYVLCNRIPFSSQPTCLDLLDYKRRALHIRTCCNQPAFLDLPRPGPRLAFPNSVSQQVRSQLLSRDLLYFHFKIKSSYCWCRPEAGFLWWSEGWSPGKKKIKVYTNSTER